MISVEQIKQLRDQTGVSLGQCRTALIEAGGDISLALTALERLGAATAEKKAGRESGAGRLGVYLHNDGSVGVLVAVACETDFVARNPEFQELSNDLALHIAGSEPTTPEELLAQPFIKNPEQTVAGLLQDKIQKFGESIKIKSWQRLVIGRS